MLSQTVRRRPGFYSGQPKHELGLLGQMTSATNPRKISNWTGKAVAAPRTELDELLARDELDKAGVYILIGSDPLTNAPRAYIGEAEIIRDRLKQHAGRVCARVVGILSFAVHQAKNITSDLPPRHPSPRLPPSPPQPPNPRGISSPKGRAKPARDVSFRPAGGRPPGSSRTSANTPRVPKVWYSKTGFYPARYTGGANGLRKQGGEPKRRKLFRPRPSTGVKEEARSLRPALKHNVLKWKSPFASRLRNCRKGFFWRHPTNCRDWWRRGGPSRKPLDLARDVARKLIEARREREGEISFPTASDRRDYTIVVAA